MKNDKYKQKTFIHWLAGQTVRLRSGREIGADKRFIRSLICEALDAEPNCWTNTTSHTTIRAELPWHVLERCTPNRSVLRTLLDPASAPARSTPINKRPGQAPSPNHHRNLTAQGLVRALYNHPFPSPGQDPSRTQANLTKRPQYGRSLHETPGHAQRNKPRILGRPSQASQHLLSPGQGPPTPQ